MDALAPWTETEHERVERWRFVELERAGYPTGAAMVLAADTSVDLRKAVELVAERGCPPDTAFRILA